ncbi:MAG: HDOD domain-containing protein [Deltaproteobacteria bacterium]|nr:HDOD domain-containing protein [Deltaproteobacteria bacterium]
MTALNDVLRKMEALPTLPTAVAKLAAVLNDDRVGAAQFEKIVRPDPALTMNLLKLANSAYFGARREIGSVRQSIAFLGIKRVFELAASAWFSQSLPEKIPGYEITAKSFFLHCLSVGALAEQLAVEAAMKPPEMVFTAGLLHDVGKLAVGALMLERSEEILSEMGSGDLSFYAAEAKVLRTDHTEIGEALVREWSLPEEIAWAARWHHEPSKAPAHVDRDLIDLVHLADGMAHSLGFGADIGELSRVIDNQSMERLILGAEEMEHAAGESVICQIWEMSDVLPGGLSC